MSSLFGAGEMIELVATYFAAKNPKLITVANRTLTRAQELCDKLGITAEPRLLTDLPEILHEYDVVRFFNCQPASVGRQRHGRTRFETTP